MQRLKKELKKKLMAKGAALLANPYFWIAVAIIVGILMAFYFIAAIVSTSQQVANQAFISEKIVPPIIHTRNLEESITDEFGERMNPVTHVTEMHTGMDFGIPAFTPVASAFDGIVSTVSYPRRSDPLSTQNAGIYVVVNSTDAEIKSSTRYLHLSEAFVTVGQSLKKGEIIGLSGSTGQSTGPHLHYEMIPNGQPAIDPKPFILMMSKLTDVASTEAFKAMKNIGWNTMQDEDDDFYFYESDKMLYINNIYLGTTPAPFKQQGTAYIKSLYHGGSSIIGALDGESKPKGGVPVQPPSEVVTVPADLGKLTDPFFLHYAAAAINEEWRSGIPASITLAQAALESGKGNSAICNNMFGIKADKGWAGPTCEYWTGEEFGGINLSILAKFRSYSSVAKSFEDHSDFLLSNGIYKTALSKKNPYEFANELQKAGYATDSQYANKLKSILISQNLPSLDMNHGIDPVTHQPFADVPFGPAGGGTGGAEQSITIVFGIRQVFGVPALEKVKKNGKLKQLRDPETNFVVVSLANYDRVLQSNKDEFADSKLIPPNMAVKDLPDAISVTIQAAGEDQLYVSHIDYVKGTY